MAPTSKLLLAVEPRLRSLAGAVLPKLGHTPGTALELQREGVDWVYARYQAARYRRGLLRGWRVHLSSEGGRAELVPAEVPRAGGRSVTVKVHASAVSPGTERAQYLRLPNTQLGLAGRVGYSAAGIVIAAGSGASHICAGDAVAVVGAPHASVVTVDADDVFGIPSGVGFEAASLVMLGVICGQGVTRAGLSAGDRFCVVGAGPIGLLTQRLAVAAGAHCTAVVATSRRKERVAAMGGGRLLVGDLDTDEIAALDSPVVVEATGDPEAIAVALDAAGLGGRIVLLGSARGITTEFPLDELCAKRARLIGAHVNTLTMESDRTGADARRREAMRFLDALGSGSVAVDDLVGPSIDPREAGLFYRRLAADRELVGAHFDWSRLPERERSSRGRVWRVPDPRGRGLDERAPLPPGGRSRRGTNLLTLGDPFEGAAGDLRIGLLGCGDIAVENAAAAQAAPNTTLVACFDPAAHLARDIAARFGAETAPTAAALIERSDVDAVLLSVPHHLHAPLGIQAARAGRHVIVEKPLANTLAGALEMADAANRAGVVLTVCFPHRYRPSAVLARRLVQHGALGELEGALVKHFVDKTPSYWIGGYSGRSLSSWRSSRELAGGGFLIMNLSHYVDLVRHISGVELESVIGLTSMGGAEVEDAVSLSVRFANGAIGSLVGSGAVRAASMNELRLWGRDGHVAVEPDPRFYSMRSIDALRAGRWQSFGRVPRVNIRAVFLSRLATAMHQGCEPDVTARDGIAAQVFMEAAYRAAEQGETIALAELFRESEPAEVA